MLHVPSTDGITLTVHELGRVAPSDATAADRPPLLLVHANGFCGPVWGPLADHLPQYRALAPDLRGHGRSPAPPDHRFEWEGFGDDVLAVVDALDLTGCVAAGHSLGGAALLMAERRRPGTFAALWCYEPIVFPGGRPAGAPTENPMAAAARRRRETFPSRQAAIDNFAAKPPLDALDPAALAAYVDGGFEEQPDGTVRLRCPREHEARIFEMGGQHHTWDHLDQVRCPVTVARGRRERGPSEFAPAVAERLPAGRLVAYEHLGHFGPLEAPAEMARAVSAALAPG